MEVRYQSNTKFIDSYVPAFATEHASGIDLRADIESALNLAAGGSCTLSTGLSFEIPFGFEGQVRSRSGLASKTGIFMLNSPGTIDADYRGVVSVVVANFSEQDFVIKPGDRIAQFVICPVPKIVYRESSILVPTKRGEGGFGSTGV
ncbi:dUTP diphosphatase [Rhizobium ruizarguesonis]|uniref:dUTP diphosphatase n=1 Tax=Rhizobium ruizarguesonis TaxID=2081791 RepID=UPI00102F30B4|nr:dUTP diphosphatase [Rhizobium ruizarguesonis]TBA92821.1 dUTP diphosphatase [Rhizobium ruizarguesonis]